MELKLFYASIQKEGWHFDGSRENGAPQIRLNITEDLGETKSKRVFFLNHYLFLQATLCTSSLCLCEEEKATVHV